MTACFCVISTITLAASAVNNEAEKMTSVIITLEEAGSETRQFRGKGSFQAQNKLIKRTIAKHQQKLLKKLNKADYLMQYKYSMLPAMSLRVNKSARKRLEKQPGISVSEDIAFKPLLDTSTPT